MNNCEKKLDALIYALGFDVVETVSHNEYSNTLKGSLFCADITQKCVEEIIDYKLTKHNNKLVDLNALQHLMPKAIESVFKIENPTPVEVEATLRILGLLNEEI